MADHERDTIRYAFADTRLGQILVATSALGLCRIHLPGDDPLGSLRQWADVHAPGADCVRDRSAVRGATEQIEAYARGQLTRFDLPLDLAGTPFQLRVWNALQAIPYGATRTYTDVAAAIGEPRATRAVGAANGRNPVPLVVPCHRVVARHGIGGFTGGLDHKVTLLALENTPILA